MWRRISVFGGGSFGTAMAQHLAFQGLQTLLWVRDQQLAETINQRHCNDKYFPNKSLHPNLKATTSIAFAVTHSSLLLLALPSIAIRDILQQIKPHLTKSHQVILGSKGIDPDTLQTMEEMLQSEWSLGWHNQVMVLSGPSFATEIMAQQPTAVVIACRDEALATRCSQIFFAPHFRAYTSSDVVGVELGGALKNVMAIAAGAITGLNLGQNARAAFVTRGLAEMARFVHAKGGKPLTLLGLSGVGDLLLTCTGSYSRNRSLGEALGRGASLAELQPRLQQVAEGVRTSKAAYALAQSLQIRAPLTDAVYRVLFEGASPQSLLSEILRSQPIGNEFH